MHRTLDYEVEHIMRASPKRDMRYGWPKPHFPPKTRSHAQTAAKTALTLTLLLLEGLYGSRVMHHDDSRSRSSRAEDEGRIHGKVWSDRVGVSPLRNPTPVYPRAPPSGAVVMVTYCKRMDGHPSEARWNDPRSGGRSHRTCCRVPSALFLIVAHKYTCVRRASWTVTSRPALLFIPNASRRSVAF